MDRIPYQILQVSKILRIFFAHPYSLGETPLPDRAFMLPHCVTNPPASEFMLQDCVTIPLASEFTLPDSVGNQNDRGCMKNVCAEC